MVRRTAPRLTRATAAGRTLKWRAMPPLMRAARRGSSSGPTEPRTSWTTTRNAPRRAPPTDYPADEEIFLHNENSYQSVWPQTLYFFCIEPPHTLGATPLADIRAVHAAIDPDVREEFTRRRWRVVRNFHEDFGVPWQQAFNTDDKDRVAAYCAGKGIDVEWTAGGLRTTAVRDAMHRHPVTGETVWFNHITFFHVSTVAPDVRDGLLEIFAPEDLPTNSYYGDGAPIPDDVVAHLRQCYRDASTRFDWQRHDVLVVDNMLAAHAREPFTGPRKIAVAMAEPSDG